MLSRVPGLLVKTAQFKNNSKKFFTEGCDIWAIGAAFSGKIMPRLYLTAFVKPSA
jgi:hypothetical protein